MQEQIAERQMQDNRRKAEAIAENEARWNLALSGLVVHLIAIPIGCIVLSDRGKGFCRQHHKEETGEPTEYAYLVSYEYREKFI